MVVTFAGHGAVALTLRWHWNSARLWTGEMRGQAGPAVLVYRVPEARDQGR